MELLPWCHHHLQYRNIIASKQFTHLDIASPIFSLLQRFTVLLYTSSSNVKLADEARMKLFCSDNKTICMENITPTADVLLQYTMQGEQPIRLVSGLHEKKHSKEALYQIPGAGLGMNATRNRCMLNLDDTNEQPRSWFHFTFAEDWPLPSFM